MSALNPSPAATAMARRAVEQAQRKKKAERVVETKLARERLYRLNQQMATQYINGEPIHRDQWEQLLDYVETLNAN